MISNSKEVQAEENNQTGSDERSCKIRRISSSLITSLPDDCLNVIYKCLETKDHRDSFGLTCRRWLQIQNNNWKSLWYRDRFKRPTLGPDESSSVVLSKLFNRFQNLKYLSIMWLPRITDFDLFQSHFSGSNIQYLSLEYYCREYSDTEFALILSWFPRLTYVSLRHGKITDTSLEILAKCCSSLKEVDLSHCSKITDSGISSLAKCCSSLKEVDLSHCSNNITDSGISFLFENCGELSSLRIPSCRKVTRSAFLGCPKILTHVKASACKLSPKGIETVVSGGGIKRLDP